MYGGKWVYGIKSGHLSIFHSFEALNDAFEVQFFSRATFLHLIKDTDSR